MLSVKGLPAFFVHAIVICVFFSEGCSRTEVEQTTEPAITEAALPAVASSSDQGIDRLTDTMSRLISKRDAHTLEVRSLKDEAKREKRSGEFPPIEKELDTLVAIEAEYRGERAGCLAVVHLCALAGSYGGTERPVHRALDMVLEQLHSYGHLRDLTICFDRLFSYDGMKTHDALTRLIEAERTLPFVRESARLCKARWQLEMVADRDLNASDLKILTDPGDIARTQEYLEKYNPIESVANQWKLEAIRELDELAASSSENHVIVCKATDAKGFVLTEDAERTNQGPTIAALAQGLSFRVKHLSTGSDALNLDVKLVTDQNWALRNQEGKLVIVQFSFKGCGPCEQMYPILRDIVRDYPDKVSVLSIMADANVETTKEAVEAGKMTWDVAWDGANGPIATLWGIRSFPFVFVFGADKKLLASDIPAEYLAEVLKMVLSQGAK